MRKVNFLIKLHKEGKLQLVEASDIIKSAYVKKSESYIGSAKLLFKNERLEEAVSMAYYSMYYTSLALFFRVGIKCENHTAAMILLKDVFSIDSSVLASAKKERIDTQYYVDFHIIDDDVEDLIEVAEKFNAELLDFIERLDSEKIEEFRRKTNKLLRRK